MKSFNSSNIVPSFESFKTLAKQYNRVPVACVFQADLETPLSAYLKLAKGDNGFLLESVEKNEQVARYSIVGFSPSGIFKAKDGVLTHQNGSRSTTLKASNPLAVIKGNVSSIRQAPLEGGGSGFLGGLVGFIGYDAVRYFEKLPSQKPDVLNLPDLYLMVTDQLALFGNSLPRTNPTFCIYWFSYVCSKGSSTSGSVSLTFNNWSYASGTASLAAVSGNYTDEASGDVVSITSAGDVTWQDATTGCVGNGTITVTNPNNSVYQVQFSYENCQGQYATLNGAQFTGLAALNTSVSPVQAIVGVTGQATGQPMYALAFTLNRN